MNLILIYITSPTRKEAQKIAARLLRKKLVACANVYGPVRSLYRWEKKLIKEPEYVLLAKTVGTNFKKVKQEVERIHSYTVPCIIRIPARSNEKYFTWVKGNVKK